MKVKTLSSLSPTEARKILAALRNRFRDSGEIGEKLIEAHKWGAQKFHDMNEFLIHQPPSEGNARAFYNWSRFVFNYANSNPADTRRITISEKDDAIASAFGFCFRMAAQPYPVPFYLWSDLAPHIIGEMKKFYSSSVTKFEEFQNNVDWDCVIKRREDLKHNPATEKSISDWEASRG